MTEKISTFIVTRIDLLMAASRQDAFSDELLDQAADVLGDWIAANQHHVDNWQVVFQIGPPWNEG